MKPLQLTNEHKEKLLEMCKALFPEYKHFGFENDYSDEGMMEYHNNDWNKMKLIHWYEFCHTQLVDKIFNKYNNKLQCIIDTWCGNPIDYLYEQFITLKK